MTEKLIEVRITDGPWKKVEPSATIGELVKSMNLFKCREYGFISNYHRFWQDFRREYFNAHQQNFLESYYSKIFAKDNTIFVDDESLFIRGHLDGVCWGIELGTDYVSVFKISSFSFDYSEYNVGPSCADDAIKFIFGGDS